MQYVLHYSTVQYATVHYSTAEHNTVKYSTSTVQAIYQKPNKAKQHQYQHHHQTIPHSVDILDRKCLVELFLKAMSCPGNLTLVELRNCIAVLKESIKNEKDGIYEDCSQRLVCDDFFTPTPSRGTPANAACSTTQ